MWGKLIILEGYCICRVGDWGAIRLRNRSVGLLLLLLLLFCFVIVVVRGVGEGFVVVLLLCCSVVFGCSLLMVSPDLTSSS